MEGRSPERSCHQQERTQVFSKGLLQGPRRSSHSINPGEGCWLMIWKRREKALKCLLSPHKPVELFSADEETEALRGRQIS
jgi:hypothetical protein